MILETFLFSEVPGETLFEVSNEIMDVRLLRLALWETDQNSRHYPSKTMYSTLSWSMKAISHNVYHNRSRVNCILFQVYLTMQPYVQIM
jgi:hypothetical protein